MSKKFGLIILVLLALLLSACELSASSAPTATPKKNKQPQESPTADPMVALEVVASQTAAALAGIPSDATPPPDGLETATPLAGLPQDPGLPTPTNEGEPPAAPTELPPPPPPDQTGKPETYTLKQGEFIFCLARRFDVDPAQTLALNGLWDSELIQPGLTVKIAVNSSFPGPRALRAHPDTYTVEANDPIYSVACLYGDVDPMNIASANGLGEPYTLTPGAQIQIP